MTTQKPIKINRDDKGRAEAYAWPGGYPLYYLTADCGVLCPDCLNDPSIDYSDPHDPQWCIVAVDVNWEDEHMTCDHCSKHIQSAYGDDE